MTFASPLLLWGLAAALGPLLAHLFMRPRARRVVFPALRMLAGALDEGRRARRIADALLLLVRSLLIAAVVLLLAGPREAATAPPDEPRGPLVVVVDDALTMRSATAFGGSQTRLDAAVEFARRTVDTVADGRPMAVILSGDADRVALGDPSAARTVLASAAGRPPHAQPLGAALRSAGSLLSGGAARGEVVIVTDGAAGPWRDAAPSDLAAAGGARVRVVALEALSHNIGVSVQSPTRAVRIGAAAALRASIHAVGAVREAAVTAEDVDTGAAVGRAAVALAASGGAETITIESGAAGVRAARISVQPADEMAWDQLAFAVWESRPRAAIVAAAPPDAVDDLGPLVLRHLLAPGGARAGAAPWDASIIEASALPALLARAEAPGSGPVLWIVWSSAAPTGVAAERLVQRVRAGDGCVLLPAAGGAPDWPLLRALLSESRPRVESLSTPVELVLGEPGSAAGGSPNLVRQRVRLDAVDVDVEAPVTYADGAPAVLERRVGSGRVALLTTSPDVRWSDLAARAGGLAGWIRDRADALDGPLSRTASFAAGEHSTRPFGGLPGDGLVEVAYTGAEEAEPAWVRVQQGTPTTPWPTRVAGVYTLRSPGSADAARYVVNWPAAACDVTRLTDDAIAARLGAHDIRFERLDSAGGGAARVSSAFMRPTPAEWLAAVVALLLAAEAVLRQQRGPGHFGRHV